MEKRATELEAEVATWFGADLMIRVHRDATEVDRVGQGRECASGMEARKGGDALACGSVHDRSYAAGRSAPIGASDSLT